MEPRTTPEILAAYAETLVVLIGTVAATIILMVGAGVARMILGGPEAGLPGAEALLRDPVLLVGGIAIQGLVFLAVGMGMTRLRVRQSVPIGRTGGAVAVGLAGGAVAFVLSTALGFLLEWVGLPVTEQPILEELLSDPANLRLLAPWVVLLAPLAEEVFFRGYVMRFIGQRVSFPAGVILSSVMFAAIHLNLAGFPVYLLVGAIFALVYARTGNLLTPIVAHATYNGVLILLIALGPSG